MDVLRGGRGEPEGGEDVDLAGGTDWRTVGHARGGVRRQRAADRAARLADLRRDPLLGLGLRTGQPALHPGRRIALVLSFGSWYLFAFGLGIVLPVGILKGIL